MNSERKIVIQECAALSKTGQIGFGEVVGRLIQAGVERYHADYSRMEATYYAPDGSSLVVPLDLDAAPIAETFTASGVEFAVRQSQRGEIKFPQFSRQAMGAGCVGYFVQLSGRCVRYFGRNGEIHTEWFPGAKEVVRRGAESRSVFHNRIRCATRTYGKPSSAQTPNIDKVVRCWYAVRRQARVRRRPCLSCCETRRFASGHCVGPTFGPVPAAMFGMVRPPEGQPA